MVPRDQAVGEALTHGQPTEALSLPLPCAHDGHAAPRAADIAAVDHEYVPSPRVDRQRNRLDAHADGPTQSPRRGVEHLDRAVARGRHEHAVNGLVCSYSNRPGSSRYLVSPDIRNSDAR